MIENKELIKFFNDLQEEINSALVSEEFGATPEQLFTDYALNLLADSGNTENFRVSYDEKISKRGMEHKVNAYSLYENYETLDLFISIYNLGNNIQSISKGDAEKALERLTKFFRNAVYKDYVNEIEESSEIFDLAHTLANVPEIKEFLTRVNVFLITNGEVKAEVKQSDKVAGYTVFYRVIDINYLYNLSEKSGVPIEIDFESDDVIIPCIENLSSIEDYQSYLAVIPGFALVDIYEQYGARLLEQNVRSFLQFTGKINKGIRKTILEEPHMFLAFNNGIAATAEDVRITELPDGKGKAIAYVKDFQIVNGGQTTASIYHTWKKNKADISKIFVQVKLTIIKDRENFSQIVGLIAEYANTQNKVSASDLSSNRENHILLEKLSRTLWAPPKLGESYQTRWFFERSRGQYKNEKNRFGVNPSKAKQFDKQNPRNQMFTKELLSKYINSWQEVYHGKKLMIGPHYVVRGSQKNYAQFLNYNFNIKPDNIYFEDAIALAIIFRAAEKAYGVSPNAIGDMRYITVPYTIAWLGLKINYKIDLFKIWKNQQVSNELSEKLKEIMIKVESFIKTNAPGSLYGEWAKKEDCWQMIKIQNFNINFSDIDNDLINESASNRIRLSKEDLDLAEIEATLERLKSIHPKTWKKIEDWGRETEKLSPYLRDIACTLRKNIEKNREISEIERRQGDIILDLVAEESPELFFDMDEFYEEDERRKSEKKEISIDDIIKLVQWDKKNRKLKPYEYQFMAQLAEGKKSLTEANKYIAGKNLAKAKMYGFSE